MHYKTKNSDKLQKLREEPQVGIGMPVPSKGGLRNMVFKLAIQSSGAGNSKYWDGKTTQQRSTIYYLYGDERRAVRKYIKENTKFVSHCFDYDSTNNPIQHHLPEQMYQLMKEEYEIMKCNNEI
jgi:hypothetical protein